MDLMNEYKPNDEKGTRGSYLQVLSKLEKAILNGNIDHFRELSNLIDSITKLEDPAILKDYCDNPTNPVKITNLVILVCKRNQVKILENLFAPDSKILSNLSVDIGRNPILPGNEDEFHHNAFYYAIRTGNVDLLDKLISKWPGNYFAVHLEELDEILSQAYDELRLKNVLLSEQMAFFVENKLIDLRFFSNSFPQDEHVEDHHNKIGERIKLLLENISLLTTEYSNIKEVDEKFLFVAKFIAQNIHVLKHQLKSTYDRLPWEEMEFSLVSFVSSHTKQQEINLFYNAILNKSKILNHLENFAKKLEEQKDIIASGNINKLADLPNIKRVKVVAELSKNCPQFEVLYKDYQQIRDVHSLQKMSDFLKIALACDPKEREGQLIIIRVLQVIGEHLKNTLESPNLSNSTSELLMLSLPKNTRKVITDLRDLLSHGCSLFEIENNRDLGFFQGVQIDTKKIDNVITDILYSYKTKMIRQLLMKICNSTSVEEIKEITEMVHNVKVDEMSFRSCKMTEHAKLKKLIKELNDNVPDQTNQQKEWFNKINDILNSGETRSENTKNDYIVGYSILKGFRLSFDDKVDDSLIRNMKFRANRTLRDFAPQIKSHSLKEIAELSTNIFNIVRLGKQQVNLDKLNRLSCEIVYIAAFGTDDIKWIEELREKLGVKGFSISTRKPSKRYNMTKEQCDDQLALKLSELKSILSNNILGGQLSEVFPSYKNDQKLQAVVEMLVLYITSSLGNSKYYLKNNMLFIDDNAPLLIGKCLRNHLAHGNRIVDLLPSDPSKAVILNANKLTEENIITSKKKIGKLINDDPFKVREQYNKNLNTINNQKTMFLALADGDLESLKRCLKKGADINARSVNLWTALHFAAAKGSSCEVITFLLQQNLSVNVKDIDGKNPLHIAAAQGRENIVKFFVKEVASLVDDVDDNGRTPLHAAAQNGHKDTVEVLLKSNANILTQDLAGLSPLYYAIQNDHINVAKFLLEKDANIDINTVAGGFTPLHSAAEYGSIEWVNFLLHNKADPNAKNDRAWTPLHAAARDGHLEILNALVLNGADVNAKVINGCTPLFYATEYGHETIVNALLKHGANIDAFDKTHGKTPLHLAAEYGHKEILRTLLKNKANTTAFTVEGIRPLHFAAENGHLEIVAILLKEGANIHSRDKRNSTPLHFAAKGGCVEVAELLITKGAEVNVKNTTNMTPLHIAALYNHKDIADLLIKNNARVNSKDNTSNTPLHAAAMSGSKYIMDLLIKHNAEVNGKGKDGFTPLHVAVLNGHEDVCNLLIQNKAKVNARTNHDVTPLLLAATSGHKNIVNILIKNKAQVDQKNTTTALQAAVEAGHKEIVEILAANGANVNVNSNNRRPLLSAIVNNHKEIVKVLIAKGANVNAEGGEPLSLAVYAGYRDLVNILLENKADVKAKYSGNMTLLHAAAEKGHKKIVNTLIKRGADVNATTIGNTTPLFLAAQKGHEEVVEILIANGAIVNRINFEGAPLHTAAGYGHENTVEVLLSNGAEINFKDTEGRTALELAVSRGHLQTVKTLLQHKKVDMNSKGTDHYTVLHIAAQEGNLNIIKYLVDNGSDINARNASGSKPAHIAAREGFKDTVEFFLNIGFSINDRGAGNQSLLHYAAMKGHLEVVKYLITQGADVNNRDSSGITAVHLAAHFGYEGVVQILLKNGAIYNATDEFYRKPSEITKNKDVINLLATTEKLFEAVKHNNSSDVKISIKAGAFVDTKNTDSATPLHYAAWKGYEEIVNILLQNRANPNVLGNKGVTPLHYAAKFSHLRIVKVLLLNGAVYDAVSDSGKTPLDFAVDKTIIELFKLVRESFKNVQNDNVKVVNDLNNTKDIDAVKVIMRARNRKNQTLVVAAMHSNFTKIKHLKNILQGDMSAQINTAIELMQQANYQKALCIFKSAYENRKLILGPDNPGTLDIQVYIAQVLHKQGAYQESLDMLNEICQKQETSLGSNHENTLETKSLIALVLHALGNDEAALDIFRKVYQKQIDMLGPNYVDTLNTRINMALVLEKLGRYEEALNMNRTSFEQLKSTLGSNDPATVCVQNNIAMVLASQGKHEEALEIYKEVLKKKKLILGIHHPDTLRTQHNIAGILYQQKKYNEALNVFQEVLSIRKNTLGQNHPDTLDTEYNLANLLFHQHKWISALKAFRECFERRKAIYGPSHITVLDTLQKIQMIERMFKLEGTKVSEVVQHLQTDMNIAASNGDIQTIQRLLKNGIDVNDKDIEGRTPLHFAVSNGYIDVVSILLENGADVTQGTNKGNTPLHIACSKSCNEIVELLLQQVRRDKLNDFIDAKTVSNGTASLHVAAKNGCLKITKSLLRYGADYNIKNKEGQSPIDLAKDHKVISLLKLIEALFEDAKIGDVEIISKLAAVKPDEFLAAINARNNQEVTLLQVTIVNKHDKIANKLVDMMGRIKCTYN